MALVTFEDLPSTNTPINASNLNNNFNELKTQSIYSTNETPIGIWINGETLYRKTIDCGALVANSTKTVDTGLSNVTYIDFDGICTQNGNGWPYKMSTATNPARLTISNNQIQIQVSGDLSTYTGYVTILYTKN